MKLIPYTALCEIIDFEELNIKDVWLANRWRCKRRGKKYNNKKSTVKDVV